MNAELEREAIERLYTRTPGRIKPVYGYYRQPNGWIKPAVVTALEELKYRREGWEPLPQYGRFDMNSGYAADNPLELLLIKGGAKELCEDQIRQQGLYMNPPMLPTCRQALTQFHVRHSPECWVGAKPVVFPQVAQMTDLGPFECRFCGIPKPTQQARSQHESVMHKEEKGDIRTGETLAAGLVEGLKPEVAAPSNVTALLARLAELEAKEERREQKSVLLAKARQAKRTAKTSNS